jgi:hypothetical protein
MPAPVVVAAIISALGAIASQAMKKPQPGPMGGGGAGEFKPTANPDQVKTDFTSGVQTNPDPTAPSTATPPMTASGGPQGSDIKGMLERALAGGAAGRFGLGNVDTNEPSPATRPLGQSDMETGPQQKPGTDWQSVLGNSQLAAGVGTSIAEAMRPKPGPMMGHGGGSYDPTVPDVRQLLMRALAKAGYIQ